jgi:acyl transferase domain-containing protein/SAM-dependent methyltransferase
VTRPADSERVEELSPLKRAILEIRELRARVATHEQRDREPIAIIGMGLRFPGGADTPDAFWSLLRDGVEVIREIPASRWDVDAYYDSDADAAGKMYTRSGGFLTGVDQFAPAFFGISPREAASMDPQQRLLLEVTWEAFERAGQAPDHLVGSKTGVFLGICNSDYARLLAADQDNLDIYFATGTAFSVAAGRLSYVLGLNGPALSVDTACSSSLTTVHLACQSLRSAESDMAVAGGVNLILSPEANIAFSRAQMMARDGHCKTFDAAADGYVRAEGCAVVILKRLSDALANGDPVLAVIRGSAVNQDGRSSGLTAPNGPAQEAVIRTALANAGVTAEQVSYVETHGTGTNLGDPIEVRALGATLGAGRSADNPLAIGSVKANIGHLEGAAGVAGLIKVVLAFQHGQIPPQINMTTLNAGIPWQNLPIVVPTSLTPWPAGDTPRIAGVSSFGFSGTNAHVILEEAPVPKTIVEEADRPLHVLTVSARTAPELVGLAERYGQYLGGPSPARLADVCFTANAGRSHFEHRIAVQGASHDQLRERLAAAAAGQDTVGVARGSSDAANQPEVAFLFTGHGALYPNAGLALFETQPTFRAALERCAALLAPELGRSILEALYPALFPSPDGDTLLGQMRFGQPALFALQFALGELWRSWGIAPTLVMGHSAGEYAAACLAGILSLEDALALVVARGRLLQFLPVAGEMVAVMAGEARVAQAVLPYADVVSIAAVNGLQSVVVSGQTAAVRAVKAELEADGIECRRLDIPAASHSPLVEPILDEFEQVARTVRYGSPDIGLVSSVTGKLAETADQTSTYWRAHLRQPVRFADAMRTLYKQGCRVFVEIGPHPVLLGMGRNCVPDGAGTWLPSLRQARGEWEQMLESLSGMYTAGVPIDWRAFDGDYARQRVVLPTYPWQRQRYWQADTSRGPAQAALATPDERWTSLLATADRQSEQGPLDLVPATYPERWRCLDRLATAYIGVALRALGLYGQPGETHTAAEVLDLGHIEATYHHLVQRWLDHLVADGLLEHESDGRYTCGTPLPATVDAELSLAADSLLGDLEPLLDYVRRCGGSLAAVLTGQESALDTLFPAGSYATVDYLYDRWPVARYFNGILRSVVEAAAANLPSNTTLRVVEIGAGTGGTTSSVLPVLRPDRTAYTFTDVSDFFLTRAQERFAAFPFVEYRLLDIEREPTEQGLAQHRFDVVVAANVLHATRDLDRTLRHVRSLLAPDGVLVMYEATHNPRWLDVTTGLIAGWQRFEDSWRQTHPLLEVDRWTAALLANGFEAVQAYPRPNTPTSVLRQHVLVVRAPSVVAADTAGSAQSQVVTTTSAPIANNAAPSPSTVRVGPAELLRQLEEALPGERHDVLVGYVRQQVAHVLRVVAPAELGRDRPLLDLGLDSLMAVELRNRLASGLGLSKKLPATLVFDHPSISAVAAYLGTIVFARPTNGHPLSSEAIPDGAVSTTATQVADMSDEEVERLLLARLDNL